MLEPRCAAEKVPQPPSSQCHVVRLVGLRSPLSPKHTEDSEDLPDGTKFDNQTIAWGSPDVPAEPESPINATSLPDLQPTSEAGGEDTTSTPGVLVTGVEGPAGSGMMPPNSEEEASPTISTHLDETETTESVDVEPTPFHHPQYSEVVPEVTVKDRMDEEEGEGKGAYLMYTHTCRHTHTHTHACIHMHPHACIHTHACAHIHTCMHAHVCTCMHTHTDTHTHHTQMPSSLDSN